MVDTSPKTRITIRVPKKEIAYLSGKTKLSYDQVKERIKEYLEFLKEKITEDLFTWIDIKVPKRTGQLRHLLKQWIGGSSIYKNVLRMVIGTNLDYADTVNSMDTGTVRHSGQKGYVYYPNIFGIRGPIILDDPLAIGSFFTELIWYAETRAQHWIGVGKGMMWT